MHEQWKILGNTKLVAERGSIKAYIKVFQKQGAAQTGGFPLLNNPLPFIPSMMLIVWDTPVNQFKSGALADSELLITYSLWVACDSTSKSRTKT